MESKKTSHGGNEENVFYKFLSGDNVDSSDDGIMFDWDVAPSGQEETSDEEDILDIKDESRPTPLALLDVEVDAPKWIEVEVPTVDPRVQQNWLQFVADNLYVCRGGNPAADAVILVSEHLLRWFSYMAAAPYMWEEEYPVAMKQSTTVDEHEAFEKQEDRRKRLKTSETIAEAIFPSTRFVNRLEKYAEISKLLSSTAYKTFVAKRSSLSKGKNLLKTIFGLPSKLLQCGLFLINDRIKAIDEKQQNYEEAIALFDANDEDMARRQHICRSALKRARSSTPIPPAPPSTCESDVPQPARKAMKTRSRKSTAGDKAR